MKKKYDPIIVPVCRCGKYANFVDVRKKFGAYNNSPVIKMMLSRGILIRKFPMPPLGRRYACVCLECGIVKSAATKRAAVEAFAREVEVGVE